MQIVLGAIAIVSGVLSLTSVKAHSAEPEPCVVGPTQQPCGYVLPPMTTAPPDPTCPTGTHWSVSPPPAGCYPDRPWNGPEVPPVVVSVTVVSPATTVDICGDYGDKAQCAALVETKFGPAKTTQRTTTPPHKHSAHTTTTTHVPTLADLHGDELFAFVQAFIAPLFTSMVR